MSRKAPWENKERHYCVVCNAWMGSDRQSILTHNNGKKHQENAVKQQEQQRHDKKQQENQQSLIQKSLQQMEDAARQNMAQDFGRYNSSMPFGSEPFLVTSAPTPYIAAYAQPTGHSSAPLPPPPLRQTPSPKSEPSSRQEKKDWESRKKQRTDSKRKPGEDDDDDVLQSNKRLKVRLEPGEGVYSLDNKTYLEGVPFGNILEAEMPVQLWTGSLMANDAEKQLPERDMYWKNALILDVRERPSAMQLEDRLVVDIAFLQTQDDTQETLEKSVPLNRIRIELQSDPSIPTTIEEARLLAMGGEEIVVKQETPEIDEATGLSSWTTVQVKRTTVRQEIKEERDRLREKRKLEAKEEARKARDAEERRMEEAKVANADDSALGAYDIWSRTKDGYKGVSIHEEPKIDAHVFGKKLSEGKETVTFKKTAFKGKTKKRSMRTTSADDD